MRLQPANKARCRKNAKSSLSMYNNKMIYRTGIQQTKAKRRHKMHNYWYNISNVQHHLNCMLHQLANWTGCQMFKCINELCVFSQLLICCRIFNFYAICMENHFVFQERCCCVISDSISFAEVTRLGEHISFNCCDLKCAGGISKASSLNAPKCS